MFGIPGLRRIFRFPWRTPGRIEHEVDAELRFHLDRRTEELVEQGMAPEAARREAARQGCDRKLEALRQQWRVLRQEAITSERLEFFSGRLAELG